MEQVNKLSERAFGAGADDIMDGHELAIEAWKERVLAPNSGLLAFAYLWRRFGPPWHGSDPHKDLCGYILTTSEPDVFLTIHPKGAGLAYGVGYLAYEAVRKEHGRPRMEWEEKVLQYWMAQHPEIAFDSHESWEASERRRVSDLFYTDRENESWIVIACKSIGEPPDRDDFKPWRERTGVSLRVNQALFDALKELERPVYVRDVAINIFGRCDDNRDTAAKPSKYAGYGISQKALDELIAEPDEVETSEEERE